MLVVLLHTLLKDKHNDWDELLVGGFVALMTMCVLALVSMLWWHNPFDPQAFGFGAAAILGGMGGGQAARDRWLRKPDQPQNGGTS